MFFEIGLLGTAVVAGGVASIAGFGIGSLITPVLSLAIGTKLAVAVVSIPHFVATSVRFGMLRSHVDRRVLRGFGLMSAAGGLIGAFLHAKFAVPALTLVFGAILLFAGFVSATNLSRRMRFRGAGAWLAGGVSGALGGLVGNQGGIRSAALLGFEIPKESFVATATAIGLIVDVARMPVYFWSEGDGLLSSGRWLAPTVVSVVVGTILSAKFLNCSPKSGFGGSFPDSFFCSALSCSTGECSRLNSYPWHGRCFSTDTRLNMNAPHLHLILNHFPIGGILLGSLVLLVSIWRPNIVLVRVGLSLILLAGLITIPTYLSGSAAEDLVEKLPGISEKFIEIHEELAEKAAWFVGVASLTALFALITSLRKNAISKRMVLGTLAICAVAMAFLAWTNERGGEISHPEIRRAVAE